MLTHRSESDTFATLPNSLKRNISFYGLDHNKYVCNAHTLNIYASATS